MDAAIQKKKQDLTEALVAYQKLKLDMLTPNFKWTIDKLKIAIKVKTLPGDKARPTTKEALLEQYNKMATLIWYLVMEIPAWSLQTMSWRMMNL